MKMLTCSLPSYCVLGKHRKRLMRSPKSTRSASSSSRRWRSSRNVAGDLFFLFCFCFFLFLFDWLCLLWGSLGVHWTAGDGLTILQSVHVGGSSLVHQKIFLITPTWCPFLFLSFVCCLFFLFSLHKMSLFPLSRSLLFEISPERNRSSCSVRGLICNNNKKKKKVRNDQKKKKKKK